MKRKSKSASMNFHYYRGFHCLSKKGTNIYALTGKYSIDCNLGFLAALVGKVYRFVTQSHSQADRAGKITLTTLKVLVYQNTFF